MLHTDQRPNDIVDLAMPVKEGDKQYIYVVQKKTEKHGAAAHIRIEVTPQLKNVVDRCRDDVLSEYLLHYPIDAKRSRRGKPYSKETIGRMFARARNKAIEEEGIFDGLKPEQLPTLYELRSLSTYLYDLLGKDAQKIAGHKNRAMTEGYLDGHPVEFTEVEGGLDTILLDEMEKQGKFKRYK